MFADWLTDQHIGLRTCWLGISNQSTPAWKSLLRILNADETEVEAVEMWRSGNAKVSRHAIANAGAESSRPRLIIRTGCKTVVFVTILDLSSAQA